MGWVKLTISFGAKISLDPGVFEPGGVLEVKARDTRGLGFGDDRYGAG